MPADAPSSPPVAIDIVSDVVCPWCYVGKRRLEAALRERVDEQVTVRWHPFQLDPTIPPGGLDRRAYMVKKFGSAERIDEIHARLTEAGRSEGIDFAFDRIERSVNTLDAHRLLAWAGVAGVQDAAAEALFRAYFVKGRDIGDHAVRADIAAAVGLDRAEISEKLATSDGADTVRAEIDAATRIGVTGVPFFIFAQSFAVSGAQASAVLATAIDRAREHLANPQAAVLSA
jgi:predicted DsbA family dithiol-disulfide isomerase